MYGTYDLYRPVRNVFYAGENITRGGPGNRDFFWALKGHEPIGECHLGAQKSRVAGARSGAGAGRSRGFWLEPEPKFSPGSSSGSG